MMVQRIQTVFLFLTAVFCALLFCFPFCEFIGYTSMVRFSVLGVTEMAPTDEPLFSLFFTWPLLAIAVVSVILPVVTIFFYKKPALQLHAIRFTFLLVTVLLALVFFYYNEQIEKTIDAAPAYGFGIYLPIICMLFLLLAMRGIKNDVSKIRSADRLR